MSDGSVKAKWDPWASYQGLREDMYRLVTRIERFDDAYWLRMFAGQAMQAILSDPNDRSTTSEIATYSVRSAEALILEIKNREENK